MSANYKSPSFLLPNELNTSNNPANDTGINSLYSMDFDGNVSKRSINLGIISEINGLTSFSISLWINPFFGTPLVGQLVFGNRDVSNSYRGVAFELGIRASSNSAFYITSSTGSTAITIPADTFTENAWNHTVFTYDGNTAIAYVNNVNVASSSVSGATLSSTAEFFIGRGYSATNLYAKGKIDEFSIFNRALDSTEIAALYGGISPNIYPSNLMAADLNPLAYYPLGEQAQMQGYLGNEASSEWQFPNGVLQDYVMDFDGTDNIDTLSTSLNSASKITISFWLNTSNINQNAHFFGNRAASNGLSSQFFTDGNTYIHLNAQSFTFNTATYFSNNKWHNYVIVFNGSLSANNRLKAYVDSTPITFTSVNSTSLTASTSNLLIGFSLSGGYFNGKISNFVLWQTDQSANLANIYNNGNPQTTYTVTPQNWWKLNATSVYTPSAPNYSTALSFVQSQADSINCGNDSSLTPSSAISISAWIKTPYATLAYTSFVDKWNGTGYMIELGTSGTRGRPRFQIGSQNIQTTITVHDDKWHHIVATCDGTTAYIYVDGNQEATGAMTLTGITTSDTFNIGGGNPSTSSWDGEISNLALFDSALTSTQVSTLFNFGTPETAISFSPVSWWKLDNLTTGIQDSGSASNNGTNNGATQTTTSVAVVPSWKIPTALNIPTINYTTALDFDGNTDYVTAGTTSYLNNVTEMSLSIWFNLETAAINKGIISDYTFPSTGHFALLSKGVLGNNYSLRLYLNDGSGNESSIQINDYPFTAGNWHNVVMTYSSSTINFYVDGQPAASSAYSGTTPSSFANSTATLNIGKYSTLEWDGKISNAQIWTTALSSSDSLSIYNNGQPSTTAFGSPVSWWKLDSTTITDSAGSNNGTNNGATQVTSDVFSGVIPVNGVSTTLPSTALQQSNLQVDSPYSSYSLSFDGNDWIDCSNSSILNIFNNISISAWVKASTFENYDLIIGRSTNNDYDLGISIAAGGGGVLRFHSGNGTTQEYVDSAGFSLALNQWYHVAIVRTVTPNQVTFFINGQQLNTVALSLTPTGSTDITRIGSRSGIFGFNGKIDETAIWNTALTSAQVLEIYNNGIPNNLSNFSGTAPVSWWRLGENAFFNNNSFVVPNSITGAPNGTGDGTITTMISADAPGTYANGIGTNLDIIDRIGESPLSESNSQSFNMIPDDKVPYVPGFVATQTDNIYSMTFDSGSSSYFNAGNDVSLQFSSSFSISAWVKIDLNETGNNAIISKDSSVTNGAGYHISFRDGNQVHAWSYDSNSKLIATGLSTNIWYHIVFVFESTGGSNGNQSLYINAGTPVTNTITNFAASTIKNLRIGGSEVLSGFYTDGTIDEVAIFSEALSPNQIYYDIYQATATNKTADLANNNNLPTPVAWYRMGD